MRRTLSKISQGADVYHKTRITPKVVNILMNYSHWGWAFQDAKWLARKAPLMMSLYLHEAQVEVIVCVYLLFHLVCLCCFLFSPGFKQYT